MKILHRPSDFSYENSNAAVYRCILRHFFAKKQKSIKRNFVKKQKSIKRKQEDSKITIEI
ncbi:hypothetical protein CPT75_08775 [Butyrivibrio fibrisolvens]|uniref:Uncharacterized protein n=1 Tax=Butyrivibrio fibrisolvens TaxID=831 RepID=A0A317FZQ2_BUTFI|nr:hypothetical protein CPT75_08775 [Butyrivibrio fibrisolvens]